jgi:hypothetical protein
VERTTYADPSLRSETWELKEDLLQLHHPRLNLVADLGWYADHFSVVVFQDEERFWVGVTQKIEALRWLLFGSFSMRSDPSERDAFPVAVEVAVMIYQGSLVVTRCPRRFLMRPQLNGGTLGRAS